MIEVKIVIALIAITSIKITKQIVTQIVVGALGVVAGLDECKSMLDIEKRGRQSSVLCSRILRKVYDISS